MKAKKKIVVGETHCTERQNNKMKAKINYWLFEVAERKSRKEGPG